MLFLFRFLIATHCSNEKQFDVFEKMIQPRRSDAIRTYGGLIVDVMRSVWAKLSITELIKCRLVCKTWCSAVLHNSVWQAHVLRFEHYYPTFKSEFTDSYNVQDELYGGQLVMKVAPKRRKVGNLRKSTPQKKWISPDGHWKGIRKFLSSP